METDTITAPENTEPTKESLLDLAYKADSENAREEGYESAAEVPASRAAGEEQPKPEDSGKKPESSETKPETPEAKAQRERDEKGRFKSKEETKPDDGTKTTDSAYEKAKKEQERQKNVLANFEAEKQRARAEIEQERKQIKAQKAELHRTQQANKPEAIDEHGFSAKDYWKASQEFAKQGDHENAYKALAKAQEIRQWESNYYQQQAQVESHKSYESAWQSQMDKSFKDDPDTDINSGSELSKTISSLLEEYPEAFYLKEGFHRIVKTAKQVLKAGSISGLEEQLQQAKAELDRLNKVTQPARGGPTGPHESKSFESLSSAEQRERLVRQAEEMDMQSNAA